MQGTGKRTKPYRWNRETAAREFGLNPRTVGARMVKASVVPGPDGRWSTQQMVEGLFGGTEFERLAKLRAERELLELELAMKRSELISVDLTVKVMGDLAVWIVAAIKNSDLDPFQKEAILRQIRSFDIASSLRATAIAVESDSDSAESVHDSKAAEGQRVG